MINNTSGIGAPKLSYYYKYNFISPEGIYAEIKEELKSYFQTGVIDDLMFPRYTEDCLKRLGRSSYKIEENIFQVEDFYTKLPDNFYAAREVWMTTPQELTYKMPNSCYEQSKIRLTPVEDYCNKADACAPKEIMVTYKTQGRLIQKFQCHYLLQPGNLHALTYCSSDSKMQYINQEAQFDVIQGKLYTNFPEGFLYMVYYVEDRDDNDYQLVPDNIRILDYLRAYLKYKCFENIYNNISDETLNQVQAKLQYYESKMYDAKVIAETEIKKQTIEQQIMSTKSARRRFNKYIIT